MSHVIFFGFGCQVIPESFPNRAIKTPWDFFLPEEGADAFPSSGEPGVTADISPSESIYLYPARHRMLYREARVLQSNYFLC